MEPVFTVQNRACLPGPAGLGWHGPTYMKRLIAVLLAGLCCAAYCAEEKPAPVMPTEVTLTTGRVLRNVKVIRWEKDRVVLKHSGGADPIAFSLVTEPLRSQLAVIREAVTNSPATTIASTAKPREIQGQVFFIAGGNSRSPRIAGVEVRLYRADTLRSYESSRALPAGHDILPVASLGFGDTRPNIQALTDYMDIEFASWDGLPDPLSKTTTDLDGRFTMKVPAGNDTLLLFARHRSTSSYERGGTRRFCYLWVVEPNAEGATILGNDQMHPSMKKALDVFFK